MIQPLLIVILAATAMATSEGDVRLVGGRSDCEGRAEFFKNGTWGTICDNSLETLGWPTVLCLQLGFGPAEKFSIGHLPGSGPISYHSPSCMSGQTKTMDQCATEGVECTHEQDVYVKCYPNTIRLAGGPNKYEGLAEVYTDGKWGSVCDNHPSVDCWPTVFCRDLCMVAAVGYEVGKLIGNGTVAVQSPNCSVDTVKSFSNCSTTGAQCGHDQDVYLWCDYRPEEESLHDSFGVESADLNHAPEVCENEVTVCEGSQFNLTCPDDRSVAVKDACYGRTPGDIDTCSEGFDEGSLNAEKCTSYSEIITPLIYQRCCGKNVCSVLATNEYMWDTCPGVHKYLKICYSCITPEKD